MSWLISRPRKKLITLKLLNRSLLWLRNHSQLRVRELRLRGHGLVAKSGSLSPDTGGGDGQTLHLVSPIGTLLAGARPGEQGVSRKAGPPEKTGYTRRRKR